MGSWGPCRPVETGHRASAAGRWGTRSCRGSREEQWGGWGSGDRSSPRSLGPPGRPLPRSPSVCPAGSDATLMFLTVGTSDNPSPRLLGQAPRCVLSQPGARMSRLRACRAAGEAPGLQTAPRPVRPLLVKTLLLRALLGSEQIGVAGGETSPCPPCPTPPPPRLPGHPPVSPPEWDKPGSHVVIAQSPHRTSGSPGELHIPRVWTST